MENNNIPKTLDEAHEYLNNFLQDIEVFKNYPEENVIHTSHMFLGRWLRNNWALWWSPELYERVKSKTPEGQPVDFPNEKPELVKWFNDIGVQHADDMSGIILISFHKKLNNKPYDLDEDVRAIKGFYQNQELNKNEEE